MSPEQVTIYVPLLLLLAVSCLFDYRARQLPNVLTLGGAVFGVVLQISLDGVYGLTLGVAGWAACLTCFLPFYLTGGMAAGDVKLMAAVGAFLGPLHGIAACFYTLVAGALVGLLCVGWYCFWQLKSEEAGDQAAVAAQSLKSRIPYAGAIAIGTTAVMLHPPQLITSLIAQGLS